MARVRVVTDSTADLPDGAANNASLDITEVPLAVHFGTQTFRDKIDITNDEFFRRLTTSAVLPTTSQPSVSAFQHVYRQLGADGSDICSVHISSKLSGTYQAACIARDYVADEGITVRVVDSLNASFGLGIQVLAAARLAREGASLDAIVGEVEGMRSRVQLMFVVDTLEYLQRGGRIGRAAALVGSLLNVKPILALVDGQVTSVRRERTRKRAIRALLELAAEQAPVVAAGIVHSGAADEAAEVAVRLATMTNPPLAPDSISISEFGPVVGTHTGPGTIGVVIHAGPNPLAG